MQDTHVISSYDFGKVIRELEKKNLYKEILMVSDSCEAFTIFDEVDSKNIVAIGIK
jgi:glycosylphosphatidylinositol transamidase (GPIT) subunit GPI8